MTVKAGLDATICQPTVLERESYPSAGRLSFFESGRKWDVKIHLGFVPQIVLNLADKT